MGLNYIGGWKTKGHELNLVLQMQKKYFSELHLSSEFMRSAQPH